VLSNNHSLTQQLFSAVASIGATEAVVSVKKSTKISRLIFFLKQIPVFLVTMEESNYSKRPLLLVLKRRNMFSLHKMAVASWGLSTPDPLPR
jgi:hypothetical protein